MVPNQERSLDNEEKNTSVNPWVILGIVAGVVLGLFVASNLYMGCNSFFDACVIGKK